MQSDSLELNEFLNIISSSLPASVSIFSDSLHRSQIYLSGIQNIEWDEWCQTLPTRGPWLLNASTFSWLLIGRDSLRRTLVTTMVIMGDLSGNRLRLAEGIIEHVAVFAPRIENTQRLLLECLLPSQHLCYYLRCLKAQNVSLPDNTSTNKYEYIFRTVLLIPDSNPVNWAVSWWLCSSYTEGFQVSFEQGSSFLSRRCTQADL